MVNRLLHVFAVFTVTNLSYDEQSLSRNAWLGRRLIMLSNVLCELKQEIHAAYESIQAKQTRNSSETGSYATLIPNEELITVL